MAGLHCYIYHCPARKPLHPFPFYHHFLPGIKTVMDDSSLSNGQSQVPGGGYASDKDVTVDDAIAYAKEVRHTLQPGKYKMFMKILNDFMAQRTDMAGVVARVKELFKDHSHLIPKFSDFLPKEYQATIYDDGEVIDE